MRQDSYTPVIRDYPHPPQVHRGEQMLSIRKIRVSVFSVQLYNHRTGVIQSEAAQAKLLKEAVI